MENLLRDLNDRQREAVINTKGPMLIVAGAGSGKTRVITYKIAYLIAEGGAHPEDITAVTFTNKATGEMKKRVEELLINRLGVCDHLSLSGLTISTFHSLCARILRNYIDRLGISKNFVIYDSDDQRSLISKLMETHEIDKKEIDPRELVSLFSSVKNGTGSIRPESKLLKLYHSYEEELKRSSALDFGDLLTLTLKLFTEHRDVLEIYQDRAKFLFVDEYQDTNRVQYKLIKLLSKKHRNICVVGDEDQSIYKWRGADINNILDFEKDYRDTRVVKLEENYRSTGNIIGASASLISKNFQRKDKKLFTKRAAGEKIILASMVNDIREAEYIASEIKNRVSSGSSYEDIAIFYRINAQSRLIEEHFRRAKIPYKIVGGIRFYDRKEIKDIISYLRLAINPDDKVSIERVINVPPRGIGDTTLRKLNDYADAAGTGLFSVLTDMENIKLSSSTKAKLNKFTDVVKEIKVMHDAGSPGSLILRTVIDSTGYIEFLKNKSSLEADERIDNISELLGAVADFEDNSENKTLSAFLESVSLLGDADEEEGSEKGVRLMTLHSAKGLEFPVVFVHGVETGLIPYIRYGESDFNDIEEERRLLYVGMTRAMKALYLTLARSRRIFGGIKARTPSMFLEEIDNELLTEYSDNKFYYSEYSEPVSTPKPKRPVPGVHYSYEDTQEETNGYSVGVRVKHPTYGDGVVMGVEGKGEKAKVTVQFRRHGIKKLMLEYANLQH